VPGHIPGRGNVTWMKAPTTTENSRVPMSLKALYEGEGVTPDKESSRTADRERSSRTRVRPHRALGSANVKNYDGSCDEYGSLWGARREVGGRGKSRSSRSRAGPAKQAGPSARPNPTPGSTFPEPCVDWGMAISQEEHLRELTKGYRFGGVTPTIRSSRRRKGLSAAV